MGKKLSPERLASIRRMRKTRRLFKSQPLFAYDIMCRVYSNYTYNDFLDDLRYRHKPKPRKGRSALKRYGRYQRMIRLIQLYSSTGNADYALQAQRLRRYMTKQYRVVVKINGEILEYNFSPLIGIEQIEQLTDKLPRCSTREKADELAEKFKKTNFAG